MINSTARAELSRAPVDAMDTFVDCVRNSNASFAFDQRTVAMQEMLQSWTHRYIVLGFCAWTGVLGFISQMLFLVYSSFMLLVYAVMFGIVVYVIYKSYFSPVLIIKELTDVGFEHLKQPHREQALSRARQARRLGQKLPPPYPNGWFALVESADLKPGDVKSVNALGENLCVYRSEDGQARCLDAYCPHLGANMAVGGTVIADCIQCPFHKWKFSGQTGECVSVPGQDTPPRGVGVRTWETCEVAGAVWVWYHAGGAPPEWQLPVPEELRSGMWGYRGRNENFVSCHIQDIPENGADVGHLNCVHSPSMITQLGEKYPFLLNFIGRHCWSAEWARGEGHTANIQLSHEYRVGKYSLARVDITATQMGPGSVWLSTSTVAGPLLVCQSVTPLSPCEQRVVHRIFTPTYNALVGVAFVHVESAMFERDVVIWNSKRFMSNPAYARSDRNIRAFRAWYAQFYSDKSVSFQDAMRKHCDPLDW